MSFVRNLSVFGASRFISTVIILAIAVITARLLSPEGRGIYALFFVLVGLFATFGSFGLSQANAYFLNREKISVNTLICNSVVFVVVASIVLGLMLGVASITKTVSLIGFDFEIRVMVLFWLASVIGIAEVCISGLVLGSHLYKIHARCLIIQALLILIATALIVPVGQNAADAISLRVLAISIFIVVYLLLFLDKVKPVKISISAVMFFKQVKFGIKNWFQNLIGLLNFRGFILVLGFFSGPEAVGYFSVALLFAEIIRFVPETIGTLLLPYLVGQENGENRNQITARICRLTLAMSFPLVLVLLATMGWFLPMVFGLDYSDSIYLAQIIIVGAWAGTTYQVMTRYFTSIASQKYSIIAALVAFFTAIGVSVMLVPRYEALGAAMAFSVGAVASAVIVIKSFTYVTGLSTFQTIFVQKEDIINLRDFFNSK